MISKKNEAANAPKKFEEFVMVMIKCGNSMLCKQVLSVKLHQQLIEVLV